MDPVDERAIPEPSEPPMDYAEAAARLEFVPPPAIPELVYAGIGTRARALAIDALLSLVIVIPLALLSGGFKASNGFLRLSLSGAPLLVDVVVWLTYMTLTEAKGGSIGKRAAGLRVVSRDGSPASLEAALVRNVFRFLDAFPYVVPYLAGAIVASKSPLKQRFGDMVAETVVVTRTKARETKVAPPARPARRAASAPPASPPPVVPAPAASPAAAVAPAALGPPEAVEPPVRRSKRPFVVVAVVLALLGAGLYAFDALRPRCSVEGGTYDCRGVRFEYPASWSVLDDVAVQDTPNLERADVVGIDASNNVELQTYRLDPATDPARAGMKATAKQLADALSGKVVGRPTKVQVGGLHGFRVRVKGSAAGKRFALTGVALFGESTEYFLACRSTPDHARELRSGCGLVLRTLNVA